MLSLASILNPAPSRPTSGTYPCSPPGSSSPEFSFPGVQSFPVARFPMAEKHRTPKELPGCPKSKAKGIVNFYPFESLDEGSLREVRKFRVSPFGTIRSNCRHIPYNSGKKDFFEKTGRESFEVFQYTFKLENDETEYTVMWDYNVGLVRMTPFFKCCNYPKTTPAKMLNLNPGLRDITHSITGGSIMAQGYWMPFACAKAVCATFCHHIAGALIPIFGPQFPAECVHPDAPDHGRMSIDPAIVAQSTREAERFRALYAEQSALATPLSPHPFQQRRNNNLHDSTHRKYDYRPHYRSGQRFTAGNLLDSPYGTDTKDNSGVSGPETGCGDGQVYRFSNNRYPYTPVPTFRTAHTAAPTSAGWTSSNVQLQHPRYHPSDRHVSEEERSRDQQFSRDNDHASPWLSAVPGLPEYTPNPSPSRPRQYLPVAPVRGCHASQALLALAAAPSITSAAPPTPIMSPKRPRLAMDGTDTDHEYDGGESHIGSSPATSRAGRDVRGGEEEFQQLHQRPHHHSRSDLQLPPIGVAVTRSVAERSAALLLMRLSGGGARDGAGSGVDMNKKADKPLCRQLPWEEARTGVTGRDSSQGGSPAAKKRRTISV